MSMIVQVSVWTQGFSTLGWKDLSKHSKATRLEIYPADTDCHHLGHSTYPKLTTITSAKSLIGKNTQVQGP